MDKRPKNFKGGHDFTKPAKCPKCGETTLNWGRVQRYPGVWYRKASCRKCWQAKSREWKQNNPERNALSARKTAIRAKYGITYEEYIELKNRQGGRCLTCGESPDKLVVDHCHSSKKVRGMLCSNCNVALGLIKDNPETLKRMQEYLCQIL